MSLQALMAEYLQQPPYNQLPSPDQLNGRLVSPIVPPPSAAMDPQRLIELLESMPLRIAQAFEDKFQWPARDAQFWIKQSALTSIAAGVTTKLVEYAIPERFTGRLLSVGVDSSSALPDIQFSIIINGVIHPGFQALVFNEGTLATPLRFEQELGALRTIQLVAKNTNVAAISVIGQISGFQKQTLNLGGSIPTNGIG